MQSITTSVGWKGDDRSRSWRTAGWGLLVAGPLCLLAALALLFLFADSGGPRRVAGDVAPVVVETRVPAPAGAGTADYSWLCALGSDDSGSAPQRPAQCAAAN